MQTINKTDDYKAARYTEKLFFIHSVGVEFELSYWRGSGTVSYTDLPTTYWQLAG